MLSATPREIPHLAPSVLPRPPASSDPATTADVGREADHLSKAMDLNPLGRDTAVEALGLGVETVGLHVLEDVESRGQELPFMARLTERFGEVVDEKLQAQLAPLRAELAEQGRKISNNYARGTLTRPFRIVPDRMGRLPTNVSAGSVRGCRRRPDLLFRLGRASCASSGHRHHQPHPPRTRPLSSLLPRRPVPPAEPDRCPCLAGGRDARQA
ncbi:hypothetical protein DFJ74DRAFT_259290 [Hyaloraphidium curvatum]|nr:hypothetical protein DFJ74DRAFT_259290 [Hyaloraphidium curvatum]